MLLWYIDKSGFLFDRKPIPKGGLIVFSAIQMDI